MADKATETQTAETVATPAVPAAPASKVVKAAPEAESNAGTTDAEPMFLRDRLDRERRSILKDLGIKLKRGEDPQERLEEYRAELDSDRTENKDLKKKVVAHEETISKLAASTAAVKVFADMEFNSLSDAQKAIVVAAAGDDPNERLKTIAIMKASAPAPVAAVPAVPVPIPAPAQTAPGATAPEPVTSQPVDVRAEHARLHSINPLQAAAYLLQNRQAYYKQPT